MPRSQPDQLGTQLRPTVEDAVSAAGFDLEEIEVREAGRRRLVRVIVDSDDGVGLDDIASLSRGVSAELDQRDDLLGGPYTLEITSPGVDRPLRELRHWRRARSRLVEAALKDSGKITGRVGAAYESHVRLLVDGALRDLHYADVDRASVVIEFRQPPAEELRALADDEDGRASAPGEDAGVTGETEEQR